MPSRVIIDSISELLIFLIGFIVLLQYANSILSLVLILFLSLLLLVAHLIFKLLSQSHTTSFSPLPNFMYEISINIVFSISIILMVYMMFYLYFNFFIGYLYAIISVIGFFGLINQYREHEFFVTCNFKVSNYIISFYVAVIIFTGLFTKQLQIISSTNFWNFIIDVLLLLPYRFFQYGVTLFETSFAFEFNFGYVVIVSLLLFFTFITVSRIMNILTAKKSFSSYHVLESKKIAKSPFIFALLLFAYFQQVAGMYEFLGLWFWLLGLLVILINLIARMCDKKNLIRFELLRIIVWVSFLVGFQFVYGSLGFSVVINNFLTIIIPNYASVSILGYLIIGTVVYAFLYNVLTNISYFERSRIILLGNSLALAFFLSYAPIMTLKIALLSLLFILLTVYEKAQFSINSNNSKILPENKQNLPNILYLMVNIVVYSSLFLLI